MTIVRASGKVVSMEVTTKQESNPIRNGTHFFYLNQLLCLPRSLVPFVPFKSVLSSLSASRCACVRARVLFFIAPDAPNQFASRYLFQYQAIRDDLNTFLSIPFRIDT